MMYSECKDDNLHRRAFDADSFAAVRNVHHLGAMCSRHLTAENHPLGFQQFPQRTASLRMHNWTLAQRMNLTVL